MNYHFVVTGIGICVGSVSSHEGFVEAIIAKKKPVGHKVEHTIESAIKEALKYKDEKSVMVISKEMIANEIMTEFKLSEQKTKEQFGQMMEEAVSVFRENLYENVLLLAQCAEGCLAVLLSKKAERCLAQVEIDTEKGNSQVNKFTKMVKAITDKKQTNTILDTASLKEVPLMNDMVEFIKSIIEVRFALKFDRNEKYELYLWDWSEKRKLTKNINGISVTIKQAELVNKAVFASKRYLIPVTFNTTKEAVEVLKNLQNEAMKQGLYKAMLTYVSDLKAGKRAEHIIVFLVEDYNTLKQQIEEVLSKSEKLLKEGFQWKSKTGSLYIRKSAEAPKVVFMNPPGGMFNSKNFHRLVSKLYDFVDENSDFNINENYRFLMSQNKIINRYLSEILITYAMIFLLETIGIKADYLSGASMGEIVFDFSNLELKGNENPAGKDVQRAMKPIETILRGVMEKRALQEKKYFGRKVNLTKYYLKCNVDKVKEAIKQFDDIFIIIEGSPKDVIICGEKASCDTLIHNLSCIAMQLKDATYVHTPVIADEFEKIRTEIIKRGLYLDIDEQPYKLFSTYLKKDMDSTSEMFGENFAGIITRPVNYTEALKTLYDKGARVFIDLSTTQLCGNWAKVTFEKYKDVEVIPIYEDRNTADYLVKLCTMLLAGNVSFDFEKMYSKLTFVEDEPVGETDISVIIDEIAEEETEIETKEQVIDKVVVQPVKEEKQVVVKVTQSVKEEKQVVVKVTQSVKEEEQVVAKVTQPIKEEEQVIAKVTQPVKEETQQRQQKVKEVVSTITQQNPDIKEQLQEYIKKQMSVNVKAYELYLEAENNLFGQALASFARNGAFIAENDSNTKQDNQSLVNTKKTSVIIKKEKSVEEAKKEYIWDREQVIEMTENSMAAVLGEQYKEVDKYPIRARMPLPPFLFVSRIVAIDAEFGKLGPGRIVADYDFDETCVFRRGDTIISQLVASEASHIGIFLMGYMGVDAMFNGALSFRALGTTLTCYSERPFRIGDTMRTVFTIHRVIQNGPTTLLFYTFDTYNGDELIFSSDASGGFFTKADLASNKGVVEKKDVSKKIEPKELLHFTNFTQTSYTQEQMSAFYAGNHELCFGNKLNLKERDKYYIPYDIKMIDRITDIDYNGGKYGRGLICGEKDITPDMWPFKVHFKNDPVFPAIIMIDGIEQISAFLFQHTGMLQQFDNVYATMMLNSDRPIKSQFRGQVRKGNSLLRYEVHVKEVIEKEDAIYVITEANIFNDGIKVIQVDDFGLKISGEPKKV